MTQSDPLSAEWAAKLKGRSRFPYEDLRMEKGRAVAADHCRGKVLEIGCGNGRILKYLQDRGVTCYGIDINPHAISFCHQKGVGAEVGDADCYDQDAQVDAVLQRGWDTLLLAKTFVYLKRPDEIIRRVNPGRVVVYQSNPLYWRTLMSGTRSYLECLSQRDEGEQPPFIPWESPFSCHWANWFKRQGYVPRLFAARPWLRWRPPNSALDLFLSKGLGILFDRPEQPSS